MGGDWNVSPELLEAQLPLEHLQGVVRATSQLQFDYSTAHMPGDWENFLCV